MLANDGNKDGWMDEQAGGGAYSLSCDYNYYD